MRNKMVNMRRDGYFSVKIITHICSWMTKTWLRIAFLLISGIIFMYFYHLSHQNIHHKKFKQLLNQPTTFKMQHNVLGEVGKQERQNYYSEQLKIIPQNEELLLPKRNGVTPKDAVWQTVHSTKSKFFVYSAYVDTRIESAGPLIRIIGAAETMDPGPAWCRFWYPNSSKTVAGLVDIIRENWGLKYSAVYVLCKLPPDEKYPSTVSVVSDIQDPIVNEIIIQVPNTTSEFKTEFEICIKPFFGDYDMDTLLMEFVEINYLLGARHFTFYNGSVKPNFQCILDRYEKDGLISVLPWYLDMVSEKEIRTDGVFAALNDCLYRNMYSAKYIGFLDIDELIIPTFNDTFIQLIDTIDSQSNITPAAYLFLNTFFCLEYEDDKLFDENQYLSNHLVMRKTYRSNKIFFPTQRSKFICNPRQTLEVGNHFIWEFLNQTFETFNVPPETALLHHYRNCEGRDLLPLLKSKIVLDRSIHKYGYRLHDRIIKIRDQLDKNCGTKS